MRAGATIAPFLVVLTLALAGLSMSSCNPEEVSYEGKYVLERLSQSPEGEYNPIEIPQGGRAVGQVEFLSVGPEDPPADSLALVVRKPDVRLADLPGDYVYNFPRDDLGSAFQDADTWLRLTWGGRMYYRAATAQVVGHRDYNGRSRPVYRFTVTFNGNGCLLPFARAGDGGGYITCYPQPSPAEFVYPDPKGDLFLFREDFGVALVDSGEPVPGPDGEAGVWWPLRIAPRHETLPPSQPSDRLPAPGPSDVMVFAAHPDDETLGCAGVIYAAKKAGRDVKIVVMTNGDAFARGRPQESVEYGLRRQGETVAAMSYLGVPKDDIFFLGYPDSGWNEAGGVYSGEYTGKTETYGDGDNKYGGKADYRCLRTPDCQHAPYTPQSVLEDVKDILSRYPPAEIYVHHGEDQAYDHKTTYRVVSQAVRELGLSVKVYKYLVHAPLKEPEHNWPNPSCDKEADSCADKEYRYRPGEPLDVREFQDVPGLSSANVIRTVNMTGSAKREAIEFYASQLTRGIKRGIPYGYGYLLGFARDEELFWTE